MKVYIVISDEECVGGFEILGVFDAIDPALKAAEKSMREIYRRGLWKEVREHPHCWICDPYCVQIEEHDVQESA